MNWEVLYADDKEKWKHYLDLLNPYFNICRDKTVLEIGPYVGIQTQVIKEHNPKKITLVEANRDGITALKYNFGNEKNIEIVHNDIFLYLEDKHDFDVVACFGVLYHLHSPLYLLELIANRVAPKYILLETYTKVEPIFTLEDDNTPGARHLMKNWKSVNISIKISADTIISAMSNLGYLMKEYNDSLPKPGPKKPPKFFIFEQQ
jgi:16S rRNA A1518/A1519 N6-dimethyltransferase RsmA/KsgA/DIM1 with predicted DNA glycosylase/AP lyase activity